MNNLKFPFSYKVIWFDGLYKDPNYQYNEDCGMGFADSYADAAKQIEAYYGNELVIIKELMLHEENSSLIILDEDVIKKYADDKYNIIHPCNERGEHPKGENE